MIRFAEVDKKSIKEVPEDGGCLIMGSDIWEQGRSWFKCHRNAEKVPVKDADGEVLCYAFHDMYENPDLRM